jgi:aspartate 1-decarboxylase
MLRIMCKSKITKAVVSGKKVYYDGSIGIDKRIIDAVDLVPGEQVDVLNVHNGERLTTYVIEEKAGSGKVILYGPAARKGEVGDELVILAYCSADNKECRGFKMKVAVLGKSNKIRSKR